MGRNGIEGMKILYKHLQKNKDEQSQQLATQEERIRLLESKLAELGTAPSTTALLPTAQIVPANVESAAKIQEDASVHGPASVTIHGDHARVVQMDVRVIQQPPPTRRFGEESVDHLKRGDIFEAFSNVAPKAPVPIDANRPGDMAVLRELSRQLITRAAMLIYSDPDHSENITCYLPRKSDNNAMVHGRHGWSLEPVNVIFTPMLRKSVSLIFNQQPIPGLEGCPQAGAFETGRDAAFTQLLKHIQQHEEELALTADVAMRPVLIRNTDLLRRVCKAVEQGVPASAPLEPESVPKLSSLVRTKNQ